MSRAKGDIAEQKALEYLQSNGFILVEKNFYSRFGEIDIIVARDETLHFVEVKSAQDYELALQNITPKKISRFLKTVDVYIKKNSYEGEYEIDAVIVTPNEVVQIENITL